MMDSMRKAAKSWVAKLLIGLLAVSFGVWGIADVFRYSKIDPWFLEQIEELVHQRVRHGQRFF